MVYHLVQFKKAPKVYTKCRMVARQFLQEQEESLVKVIQVCGDWSCPLSTLEIRMIARRILNKEGRSVPCFKKNLPGTEWAHSFLT